MNSQKVNFINIMIQTYLGFVFFGGLGQLTYFSSTELSIIVLVGLLKVLLGLTKRTLYSFSSIFVGSIREVTMLIITVHIIAAIGELGPSWGNLGHEFPTLLCLCDPRKLLSIGVSLMPPIIVNLLSLVGPNPLLEPSLICLKFVSNCYSIV